MIILILKVERKKISCKDTEVIKKYPACLKDEKKYRAVWKMHNPPIKNLMVRPLLNNEMFFSHWNAEVKGAYRLDYCLYKGNEYTFNLCNVA